MILCIDTSKLGKQESIQKTIKLGDILVNNTKYFSESELEGKVDSRWKPLSFATTIRSILTNKVLCFDIPNEDRTVYYHTFKDVDKFVHKGYDLVMFLSSLSVLSCLNDSADKEKLNELMFNGSLFKCQGIYYNAGIVNPVVYSIIYIKDDEFNGFFKSFNLSDNCRVEDIKAIKEDSHGNLKALIDEIYLIDKENEHGI